MMTDELILMLDKFEVGIGKRPTKIICGETAFEKLRREAINDWGADRYLEPNINRDGDIAKFMDIPIQVIHNPNVLEDDKIYVVSEPGDVYYKPIQGTHWWVRQSCGDFTKDFERHYYGKWNTVVQKEEELTDISDDVLMSILNGGGFNATA